jgi:glycosyltransferase involved in cell wall biosynthesis
MNIIINTSTCVTGGGIQVCSNIIIETLNDYNNKYFYILSKEVNEYLHKQNIIITNNVILLKKSPANIFFRNKFLKNVNKETKNFNANLVFTVFGPSYINFKIKHLVGFADPWVTHPNKYVFKTLNTIQKIYRKLLTSYKLFYLRNEKYIWVETEIAKNSLLNKLNIKTNNVFVIPNSCNPLYYNLNIKPKFDKISTKIFILTAYYKHKNLEILIPLIKKLIDNGYLNFQFVLTLPENCSFIKKINKYKIIKEYIINKGPLSVKDCIKNYEDCSIVFLPTLLENVSAVYLETILINKPFITTDFNFSRSICKNSCLYFKPMDSNDAYNKIIDIYKNDYLRKSLIENQKNILVTNPKIKFNYYLDIFNSI